MPKGWLIVNSFIHSSKFDGIYSMLKASAESKEIDLRVVKSGSLPHSVNALRNAVKDVDFALFWDKDVILANQLEAAGLRLFNSASAVEKCDNKALTATVLEAAGVPVPETYCSPLTFEGVGYNDTAFLDSAAERLGFPMVVKENFGSFGAQVYLAESREELGSIVERLGSKGFVMQKFIESSRGRDLRVNVVGGKAVATALRYSVSGDFRSNVTAGGRILPYAASEEQETVAVAAADALGLDFAGVDVLFGPSGEPLVCEVNSNPHFKSTLEATGRDISRDIIAHVLKCLRRR